MKYINIISLFSLCIVLAPNILFNKNHQYQINDNNCLPTSQIYIETPQSLDKETVKRATPPPAKIKPKYIDID